MQSSFGLLLEETGKILNLSLKPDHLNVCKIVYPEGITIQIEMDRDETKILMGAKIGAFPPGRYRQDVLEQALKANGRDIPKEGVFNFSKKTGELFLTAYMRTQGLTGTKMAHLLTALLEKAKVWRAALNENRIPAFEVAQPPQGPTGMFGLVS